jgi:hypothetical protein
MSQAVSISETSVNTNQITRRNISGDSDLPVIQNPNNPATCFTWSLFDSIQSGSYNYLVRTEVKAASYTTAQSAIIKFHRNPCISFGDKIFGRSDPAIMRSLCEKRARTHTNTVATNINCVSNCSGKLLLKLRRIGFFIGKMLIFC